MSALVYVETSIPSFYFETRSEAEHQARRQWMREWWPPAGVRDTLVTSLAAIEELERAREPKRSPGIALLEPLPLLETSPEVDDLVSAYLVHKLMPQDAVGDARHLALATFSWVRNPRDMGDMKLPPLGQRHKQAHIRRVDATLGFSTPALVTPLELLKTEA